MKVFKDGKHVKLVPIRYESIEKSILKICGIEKKRLLPTERVALELELLMHNLDRLVLELISGYKYQGVRKIQRRDDTTEYRAQFENAPEVRVPA